MLAAQAAPLPTVPKYVTGALRDSLESVRTDLENRLAAYRSRKAAYDATCTLIPADQTQTITSCAREHAAELPKATALAKSKADYVLSISRLDSIGASNPGFAKVDRTAPVEPPSPVIDDETEFNKDPIEWRDRQELRVRHAVFLQKKLTAQILTALRGGTAVPPAAAVTQLSALSAGDVLLVAPAAIQYGVGEYVKGQAIALSDYALRAVSAFSSDGLSAAANVKPTQLSHALTFIREVNGRRFFLDHDLSGTHVIDEVQFARIYGSREMLVARPQAIVDGRELWKAASDLQRNQRGFGVGGDRVACSGMCTIAVGRATTTTYTGGNLGPIDTTPGDFYDKTGNVGKYFIVTRLELPSGAEKK